jgi:tripeptide aminopeptidase
MAKATVQAQRSAQKLGQEAAGTAEAAARTGAAYAEFRGRLLERFIRYAEIGTASDSARADAGIIPSTEGQRVLARALEQELASLGAEDAHISEHCYVCARIPASRGLEAVPPICFLAHLDTAESARGKHVEPQVVERYDGAALTLRSGAVLDPASDAELARAVGETIITTTGDTLLGADDKAGIAEIVTAAEILLSQPEIAHGEVEIVFTPDEETGHGMDFAPLGWLRSKQGYTVDGGEAGVLEAECFNAWKSTVAFSGKAKHTGTARPDMMNAVCLAADFVALLPKHESPETTDGRQGFYAPMRVEGSIEAATVTVFLRDFDAGALQERLKTVEALAAAVSRKYAGSSVSVTHCKQYANMKDGVARNPAALEALVRAVRAAGLEPRFEPIRGGTDGARLTELGIPAPNVFTGGHGFHSRTEWASLDQMAAAVRVLVETARQWAAFPLQGNDRVS